MSGRNGEDYAQAPLSDEAEEKLQSAVRKVPYLSSIHVKYDLRKLSNEEQKLLMDQTVRILDRHAEIQQNQRKRAIRVLQAYIAGVGVVITGVTFLPRLFNAISFGTVGPVQSIIGFIAIGLGVTALVNLPLLLYDIPTPLVEVLSPSAIRYGWLDYFLQAVNIREARGDDGRSGIRSVSKADRLSDSILDPATPTQIDILADRLERIDDNETVINYNITQLQRVYQRFVRAVEFTAVGLLLLLFGGALLDVTFSFSG